MKKELKEYMEKLMNKESEWDHRISATVKEGPADCTRIDEVAAALKKMKRPKAPGLSGLVAEMIQIIQGILELSGYWTYVMDCETRLHPRGLEVKCGITNLQRNRGSNGTCFESSGKDPPLHSTYRAGH